MKNALLVVFMPSALIGCTVEHIAPPNGIVSRVASVNPRDVSVYETLDVVPGAITVIEELSVQDDGDESLRSLEEQLRVMAGARGANAIVLDPFNRRDNGTRVVLGPIRDQLFTSFRGTAIKKGEQSTSRPNGTIRQPREN